MTATAPSAMSLHAFNDDAMDVHSDHEAADGDIDIDIGSTTQSVRGEDDALSLQDAGTDGEAADVDDDMVDKEDLIEEDEIGYDDLELEDAGNSAHSPYTTHTDSAKQSHVPHASTLPSVASNHDDLDEDLIDYSDEEDVQEGSEVELTEAVETRGDASTRHSPHEETDSADAAVEPNVADEHPSEPLEHDVGNDQGDEQTVEPAWDHDDHNASWEEPSASQYEEFGTEYTQEALVHEDQQAGQQVEEKVEPPVKASVHEASQPAATSQDDDANPPIEDRTDQPEEQPAATNEETLEAKSDQSALLPVTIKYGASELWLIKSLDSEGDDWLLEDESVVTQPLFNLFAACRKQLDKDLNNDTEIGLHFDNFYGLEVFEESTACAYSTLKEYMDIYASLHAQDGLTDPQPMYVTLKFRPRVSALLSELKEAVEAGIGFRGLQEAVESGHSNFSEMVKEDEDYGEYWEEDELEYDNDEELDAEAVSEGQQGNGSDAEVKGETGEEQSEKDAPSDSQPGEYAEDEANAHADHDGELAPSNNGAGEGEASEHNGEPSQALPAIDAGTDTQATAAAPANSVEEYGDEGLIEVGFEDGEDEADHRSSHHNDSPGTVQGDEKAGSEDDAEHVLANGQHEYEDASHPESYTGDHETIDHDDAHADSASQYNHEEDAGADNEEYAQEFETNDEDNGEYAELGYGGEGDEYYEEHENFVEAEAHDADTTIEQESNQIAEVDDQLGDAQYETLNEVEEYAEFADGAHEFAEDDTTAFPDDEGEFFFDEEAAEAAVAAVQSPAAPPDVAPSVSVDDSAPSPQGQKRPLDEVDVGSDGAGAESGTNVMSSPHYTWADILYSDAKKPKL